MVAANVEERVSRLEGGYEHLATRADLADLRADFAELRADVKVEIGELKVAVGELKTDLIKWMVSAMLGSATVVFTMAIVLGRWLD